VHKSSSCQGSYTGGNNDRIETPVVVPALSFALLVLVWHVAMFTLASADAIDRRRGLLFWQRNALILPRLPMCVAQLATVALQAQAASGWCCERHNIGTK
jgi:hypothetical protein